jgi:hypothetical protein
LALQEGLESRPTLHRLASQGFDGSSNENMPHRAFQHFLEVWVPLLVDECDFAAACLLLYRAAQPEGAPEASGVDAMVLVMRCETVHAVAALAATLLGDVP